MPERATDNYSDPHLLRSNIPEYSFVGFAGATSSANTVALTIGLVTAYPIQSHGRSAC